MSLKSLILEILGKLPNVEVEKTEGRPYVCPCCGQVVLPGKEEE